jgi:transcriptional regulator with XRE-family HTH domain
MEEKRRPNERLRYERELRGWSQRTVAERVGTAEQVVNRWESGRHKPNRYFQTQLCELFGKSAKELGFMPAEQEVSPLPSGRVKDQERESNQTVDRREAVKHIGSLGLTSFTMPNALLSAQLLEQHPDLPNLSSLKEATPEVLHHFTALTETCRHLSEGDELQLAEHILWSYLPRVEAIATLSFEQQYLAAAIASQGYLLAASLAGHRNNLLERLRYSEQALLYAKLAQDRNLQVVALRQAIICFDYMGYPEQVLHLSQRTFPLLNDVSPLLRACLYAGISGAYAQLKQQQQAERFIDLAYEYFPEKPENEPGYLHTICRYSTLIFFDGLNYLNLGLPREAEKILARIDGLHPKMQIPARVRVELLNYQIEVFTALQDMEQACTYLETAAQAALVIGSERHLQDSSSLFQRMKVTWPNERKVQQLEDLFV